MKYCSECDENYPDNEFDNHICSNADTPIDSIIKMLAILFLFGIFGAIIWFILRALLGYA